MTDTSAHVSSSRGPNFGLPPPKRGIRVRVNSLGVMFKNNSAPSSKPLRLQSHPTPQTQIPTSFSHLEESCRIQPSSSASSAQSPHLENGNSSLLSHHCRCLLLATFRSKQAQAPPPQVSFPPIPAQASNDSEPSSATGPTFGFNRRNSGTSTAAPSPHGLLRRMGSKSFLNLNQSKAAPVTNSSSDDSPPWSRTDSHASDVSPTRSRAWQETWQRQAPLSPVREADVLDFPPSSPTPHRHGSRDALTQCVSRNATQRNSADYRPTRSKAGALFQTLASAASNKAIRSPTPPQETTPIPALLHDAGNKMTRDLAARRLAWPSTCSSSEYAHCADAPPKDRPSSWRFFSEGSRVGSSISTAATTSTSDSLRTKSSATSFNVAPQSSASALADPQSAFQADFASRIWCTYRNHFAPILAMEPSRNKPPRQLKLSPQLSWQPLRIPRALDTVGAALSDPAHSSSPPASAGPLGAGYANASTSLGEKMGISNLWSRATAAAQAAGFSRAGLNTDSGWGCMLRTGQSLLANALINVIWPILATEHLRCVNSIPGRACCLSMDPGAETESLAEWRENRARHATYIKILSWFLDDPSPACPFGVHRMAREGKRLGKEVGEWFGPSTAAGAIKQLVLEFPDAGIAVELAHDGVFYLDEQFGKARSSAAGSNGRKGGAYLAKPVLILIGIRLGLDSVNPIYYESVKATFSFPHSVGIAGGRPSSSYYFMVPRQFDIAHRFMLEDNDDEDEWWSHAYSESQTSTFHVKIAPKWVDDDDFDPSMESFSEPSVGEESGDEAEASRDKAKGSRTDAPIWTTTETFCNAQSIFTRRECVSSPPGRRGSRTSDKMFRESQQRTAAWLGHGHSSSSSTRAYSNAAGGGGIAFPSLDLLSPQPDGPTLQRPARSDIRQASMSSAATTRPARRDTNNMAPVDSAKGETLPHRDLQVSRAQTRPPHRGARPLGPDESFSTVHLSDSEIGPGAATATVGEGDKAGATLASPQHTNHLLAEETVAVQALTRYLTKHPSDTPPVPDILTAFKDEDAINAR
ncbi:uncharacterized protein UTRI_02485 [Ustilago trichophora]|uniref:Autophagy-related protein 4 n=1 Tax=Ustilago trichophora TaxID=86804 RepID=A0A5C3EAI8_9BASI|nr:uncharacterized protein UTRI_02485 [Ustilago trichophora]